MDLTALLNSLILGSITAVIASGLGFLAGLGLLVFPRPLQLTVLLLAALGLALPPFLVTNSWLILLGPDGLWQAWLPAKIASLGGAVWILTLFYWPIGLLLTWVSWSQLDPAQWECDPNLRGIALIRWLLWPTARPFLGVAVLLIFALALNNFSVPTILQINVLPARMWVNFSTKLNYAETLRHGWPLVIIPVVLLLLLRSHPLAWPAPDRGLSAPAARKQLGFGLSAAGISVALFILILSLGIPLAPVLGATETWAEIPSAFQAARRPTWNSLVLPSATASVCLGAGWWLGKFRAGWGFWIFFFSPGIFLGMSLIQLLNWPGTEFIYGSNTMIVLAWSLRYLAFGWTGLSLARRSLDPDLPDATRLNGGSTWAIWRHVHGPQLAPHAAIVWYVIYLLCLWDVETMILIVPPGGETLALRVFNLLHYGHNSQVNALCVLLLGLALLPLFILWLARWIFAKLPGKRLAR